MKIAFILGGLVGTILAILYIAGADPELDAAKDPVERIKVGCKRQYASAGERAVGDCIVQLMVRYVKEQDRARLDAAYSRVR